MDRPLGMAGIVPRFSLALLLSGALVLPVALVACGDDGADSETGSGSRDADGAGGEELEDVEVIDGSEAEVRVIDNTFDAQNIQIEAGTTVVWTNNGRQDHDIVPTDDGDWGVEPAEFEPHAVYQYTFEQPGTYHYYCSLHGTESSGMIGAVVVE